MRSDALDTSGVDVTMVTPLLVAVACKPAALAQRTELKTVRPCVTRLPRSTVASEREDVGEKGLMSAPPSVVPAGTRVIEGKQIY